MTKVTVHTEPKSDTPTQAFVKAANQGTTASDALGRLIGIRKLLALDRLRMFEVVGAENAKNEPYLGYAALAFHVCSIDGNAVARPSSKRDLEALIQRLGDEGMEAVSSMVQELFVPKDENAGDTDAIKNL